MEAAVQAMAIAGIALGMFTIGWCLRGIVIWRRGGLKRPWGVYRDGLIIGMYETKEAAEAAMPPDIKED